MSSTNAPTASLPRDDDSSPIQVLSPATSIQISATEGSSASVALESDSEVIRIASTGAVFVAFGTSGVDAGTGQADSFVFPAGVEFFFMRDKTNTHVAARSIVGSGNQILTITKMR